MVASSSSTVSFAVSARDRPGFLSLKNEKADDDASG